jgi:hypothetical protein
MKASRCSEEQSIHLLPQAERSEPSIRALGRAYRLTQTTFDRWRQKGGGLTIPEAQR